MSNTDDRLVPTTQWSLFGNRQNVIDLAVLHAEPPHDEDPVLLLEARKTGREVEYLLANALQLSENSQRAIAFEDLITIELDPTNVVTTVDYLF